jgi:small-conductance mechanosensitive channel
MDFQVVIDSLTKIGTDIINFIPNLINGLIILIVGFLVAGGVRWVLHTILRRLRFDPLVERTGITGSLRGLGVKTPLSTIVAQTVFALLLLSFMITATRLMGLEAVAILLERLLLFLPNIIASLIVFLLGGIVAKFIGDLLTAAAAGSGMRYGQRVGKLAQHLISLFVVVLALDVLGVDTGILVTALTITIASFGLALGLALGLGSRGIVQHVLAGYYLRQRFAVGQQIAVDQVRGEVSGIGGVNTLVATEAGAVILPNTLLLESVIQTSRPASPEAPAVVP